MLNPDLMACLIGDSSSIADGGPSVKMPVKRPSSSVQTSRPEKKPVPMNEVQVNEVLNYVLCRLTQKVAFLKIMWHDTIVSVVTCCCCY